MSAIQRCIEIAGGQAKVAAACGVSQSMVSQWVNGSPIQIRHFPALVLVSEGQVTEQELLADELAKVTPKASTELGMMSNAS